MSKLKRKMWAVEVNKREASTGEMTRALHCDREGPLVFGSKQKVSDHIRGAMGMGRLTRNSDAEIVRVMITIEVMS